MEPKKFLTFQSKDNSVKIEQILTDLGYNLSDRGRYWQCSAVYRDGDNQTALQIWKDTGIWKDFVANTKYLPFEKLLQLSCKSDDDLDKFLETFSQEDYTTEPELKAPKMDMEEFFDKEEVRTLLPHYNFYNEKGISDDILKLYHSGFMMSGKLNGRYSFPVFDGNKRVIGWSGRHLMWNSSSSFPKWKHLGKKANWIYPINLPFDSENVFLKCIEEKREIILVESIGDSLALSQQGFYNHMVVFGLKLSSKQLSYLVSLDLDRITISTNNDSNKSKNRGLEAALNMYIKLSQFFDLSKIQIKLPRIKGYNIQDFGDILEKKLDINDWYNIKINKKKQLELILNSIYNNNKHKTLINLLKDYLFQLDFETNPLS